MVLIILVTPMMFILSWTTWVETYQPYPEKLRRVLFVVVICMTAVEGLMIFTGRIKFWLTYVLVLVNGWGYLDAVMRFPVVHSIYSVFTIKNVILLAIKIISLPFAYWNIAESAFAATSLLSLIMMNMLGIPTAYMVSLPFEHPEMDQRIAAHDVDDVDILQQGYRLVFDGKRREEVNERLRKRMIGTSREVLGDSFTEACAEVLSPTRKSPGRSPKERKAI